MKLIKCLFVFTPLLFSLQACNQNPIVTEVIVTLDPDGGTITHTTLSIKKGTKYSDCSFDTPTKTDCTFNKWTFSDGSDIPTDYIINENITFKANYTAQIEVTVTLDPDGGTIAHDKVKVTKGTKYSDCSFDKPVKTKYTFNKWTFSDGLDISNDYVINSDITFKAYYTAQTDAEYIESLNITKLGNTQYLYEATYDDYDFIEGQKYLDNYHPSKKNGFYRGGNCSSIYYKDNNNQFYGRNMDWLHGTIPEFVIHTTAKNNRHATLGVAFCADLKNEDVGTTRDMSGHRNAPFITTDGINDAGLCASMNEIDKRDCGGINLGTNPGKTRLSILGIVRYILDYASTVVEAETLLKELDIYTPSYLFEQHIMIADATGDSAEIEFDSGGNINDCHKSIKLVRNHPVAGEHFNNIATNFNFLTYDGTIKSLEDNQTHACGVERYNILKEEFAKPTFALTSLDQVLALMSKTYYTKSYTISLDTELDQFWFSEFYYTGTTDIKTAKTKANFQHYIEHFLPIVKAKTRRNDDYTGYYNTLHSVAYDMNAKTMKIVFEEEHHIDKVFSI